MKHKDLIYYIAGPMTNYEQYNYPLFEQAAEYVRDQTGAFVVSPHELDHGDYGVLGSIPWEEYVRTDLENLLGCTAIVLLPKWEDSRGARLEEQVARELNYYMFEYSNHDGQSSMSRLRRGNPGVLS